MGLLSFLSPLNTGCLKPPLSVFIIYFTVHTSLGSTHIPPLFDEGIFSANGGFTVFGKASIILKLSPPTPVDVYKRQW